jgi:hypothetical protein
VKPTESPPAKPAESLKDARNQLLAAADIHRPLLPEMSLDKGAEANSDYGSYLRALQQLTKQGKSHSVDVFE